MPERNLTQDSSVPSTAEPIAAPMISCAIVPTTISDNAVEIRNQIESRLAINARPSHNAASAQTPVILKPPISCDFVLAHTSAPCPFGQGLTDVQTTWRRREALKRTPADAQAPDRSHQPLRRLRGTPSPGELNGQD